MKKLLIIVAMLYVLQSQAQNTITGKVIDSSGALAFATVTLRSSHHKAHTESNKCGFFYLKNVVPGYQSIKVSMIGHRDTVINLQYAKENKTLDIGTIFLQVKSGELSDFVVMANLNSIVIKGDTLIYSADSFQVNKNADLSSLLDILPGLSKNEYGYFVYKGQVINNILIDGKPYFRNNQKMITENLRADMVEKVKLYSIKDNITVRLSGGQGVMVMDIQLKPEKRRGHFGELEAGSGTNGYYKAKGIYNDFAGKRKMAIYGSLTNTESSGMPGSTSQISSSFGINMGGYNGQGLPVEKTAGAHYDNSWGKHLVNADYGFRTNNLKGSNETLAKNILPDGIISTQSTQTYQNHSQGHQGSLNYQLTLDSSSYLSLSANGGVDDYQSDNHFTSSSYRGDTLLNSAIRTLNTGGSRQQFSGNIQYRKTLSRKGGYLSVRITGDHNKDNSSGHLISDNFYFSPDSSEDNINQMKQDNILNETLSGRAEYGLPISNNSQLYLDYEVRTENHTSERLSYSEAGVKGSPDDEYSSNYKLSTLNNQFGAGFSYSPGKFYMNIGIELGLLNYKQTDLFIDSSFKRTYENLYPLATFRYNLDNSSSINLNYSGHPQLPAIEQIQPYTQNNDPLNLYIGNPSLDPTYNHAVSLAYSSFNTERKTFLNGYANLSIITDPIIVSMSTDDAGKNTYRYINLTASSNKTLFSGVDYELPIIDELLNLKVGLTGNIGSFNSLSDNKKATIHTGSYGFTASVRRFVANDYELKFAGKVSYNTSYSSLQKGLNNNGLLYEFSPSFHLYLPAQLELASEGNYTMQPKTATFDVNLNRFIWNAWIGKRLFNEGNLLIKLSAHDLLNQSISFNRAALNNLIYQTTYNTIGRYFLLSAVWNFNSFKK